MSRRFNVKKEIRALGLDLCNPKRIVGVVVRGGLYLDGVVVFPKDFKQESRSVANEILRTRFYPELKLIMTHDPQDRLNIRQIEQKTRLPIIQLETTFPTRRRGFATFRAGKRSLLARSTLETKTVQEVLAKTWTVGVFPESLRVAHLIAKSHFREKTGLFWANK